MKVLVTGATSLLGAGVARALDARGDEVSVFQRNASGLGWGERLGSVTDAVEVAAAVTDMDAVVHLAARVSATGSWEDFESTNVRGTEIVVTAARAAGVRRFVHVSSPSVAHHGRPLIGAGAGVADPAGASSHYSRSKALGEIAALGASARGFSVVAIRPHLVWGPGDTQLIGRIVERAQQGRLALVGSGTALIDTTYLDNAVDALVAAVDRAPLLGGKAFVVSNGQPRTVHELLSRIVAAAGLPSPSLRVPAAIAKSGGRVVETVWERQGREDDPPMTRFLAEQLSTAHWFDQRHTRAALDWTPRIDLDEGFRRLTAWFAVEAES